MLTNIISCFIIILPALIMISMIVFFIRMLFGGD